MWVVVFSRRDPSLRGDLCPEQLVQELDVGMYPRGAACRASAISRRAWGESRHPASPCARHCPPSRRRAGSPAPHSADGSCPRTSWVSPRARCSPSPRWRAPAASARRRASSARRRGPRPSRRRRGCASRRRPPCSRSTASAGSTGARCASTSSRSLSSACRARRRGPPRRVAVRHTARALPRHDPPQPLSRHGRDGGFRARRTPGDDPPCGGPHRDEIGYGQDGTPILLGTNTYRGDAYRFEADLYRRA